MRLLLIFMTAVLLCGCSTEHSSETDSYQSISQETAKEMMAQNDGHIIVDVRTYEEYITGYIPGAVCIPNESIGTEKPAELKDTDQIILIYCRSGRRSKQAAQKLADLGYTHVYEFGGINDWDGEIIDPMEPRAYLVFHTENESVTPELMDNSIAEAFFEKLQKEALQLTFVNNSENAYTAELPWSLPASCTEISVQPWDIAIDENGQIVLVYAEHTGVYEKLAVIDYMRDPVMADIKDQDTFTAEIFLEWTE